MRRLWTLCTASLLASTALALSPTEASACGGTFCDAGPQSMPVDQKGENILFVSRDGAVEAHVQIQYDGNPEKFAWIVPVMAVPEIEVGSDPLFDALLGATVPTFQLLTRSLDSCGGGGGTGFGCADVSFAAGGDFGEEDDQGPPRVLDQDVVGAYEYAVIEGGSAASVSQWLDDNGYAQDDEAPAILQQYLDEGFAFVAFKLRSGSGLDEIHPVVLRTEGGEPCIPLRLTRIAAQPDMGVRAFFLGDGRVVPSNYRHVEINPLKIDWLGLGSNYEEVVTLAIDEAGSDGHGFVTEYAGPSGVVDPTTVHSDRWNSAAFIEMDPVALTGVLIDQELLVCGVDGCFGNHPLLNGLLQDYFPAPAGVPEEIFYACTSCYAEEIPVEAWDGPGFAAAFEERIVGPGEHALDLLDEPYLTRLYSTISPEEMTLDPLFHENASLPDVSNVWTATQVIDCEGPDVLELPDGREVVFDDDDVPPSFDDLPWAQRIDEVPAAGAPMALVDNTEAIDAALAGWNGDHQPQQGCDCRATRRRLRGSGTLMVLLMMGLWARRRRPPRRARR